LALLCTCALRKPPRSSLRQFEITKYLAASQELDTSLLNSERQAIMDLCDKGSKEELNGLMHDLYTQACERLKVVESLNNDNLDSARDNLKVRASHVPIVVLATECCLPDRDE
jgi:hypothetical protein